MGKKDNWLKHMKRMIKPSSLQPETSRNSSADNEILEEERGLNRIGEDASMLPSTPEKITEEMNGAGNIHALAIANATAAASAAAAAAARAAAEVVRLASNGISAHDHNYFPDLQISGVTREDRAATKIQAVFRCHLAKKALRALKGIVKLQAVVRGYCVRKQARMTLRCMQTLIRLQSRVRSRQIMLMDPAPTNYSQPNLNASKIPTAALQGRRINATADYCYASDLQPVYCNYPAKRLALVEVSDGGYRDWGWMEEWAEGSMNESSYLRDDVSGKESILLSSGGASVKSSEDSGAN